MDENRRLYVPFDQYQRYETVARVINYYRKNSAETFHILEVGAQGYKNMKLFLPNDQILFTDIELTESMRRDPDFQLADGTALPFEDNSFDFVFATDVLEHVPEEKRRDFLSEVSRVARVCAVLSFPYLSCHNTDTESRWFSYYKSISDQICVNWLEEHLENGLPELDEVNALLNKSGYHYFNFFHGDVKTFEKIWYSLFNVAYFAPETTNYCSNISHYYNCFLYEGDISDTCYRTYYVISDSDLTDLEQYISNLWVPRSPEREAFLDTLLLTHWQLCQQVSARKSALSIFPPPARQSLLRRGWNCYRENGLLYTLKRLRDKLLRR